MATPRKKKNGSSWKLKESQKTLHQNLDFTATEQYKLLRTNLKFTFPENVKCPVIGITSSIRGEGKSTTSINLSYVLAEQGSRVLLIDGDLRLPSVAQKMQLENRDGLTDLLMGKSLSMENLRSPLMDNWYIMPSGDIPPNPSELLGSSRMDALLKRLQTHFDYIIIDLPPVNIVSDAASISSLVTGMVVVVRENYTRRRDLDQCFRQFRLSGTRILGCVMNESGGEGGSYRKYGKGRYYKYYRSRPYGGREDL